MPFGLKSQAGNTPTMLNQRVRPTPVDGQIRQAIDAVTRIGLLALLNLTSNDPVSRLVIKYISPAYGGEYPPARRATAAKARRALHISTATDFTWGTGCYVCPLQFPFSAAIYGRCGIIAEFDPTNWKIFHANNPNSAALYMNWVQWQPLYQLLTLTVHADLANQYLRNSFRETFEIDCVVFPPDEINPHYTKHSIDRWLAVSDWASQRRLARGGTSGRFRNPKLVVVVAEDFEKVHGGLGRRTLISPQAVPFTPPVNATQIANAYATSQIITLTP